MIWGLRWIMHYKRRHIFCILYFFWLISSQCTVFWTESNICCWYVVWWALYPGLQFVLWTNSFVSFYGTVQTILTSMLYFVDNLRFLCPFFFFFKMFNLFIHFCSNSVVTFFKDLSEDGIDVERQCSMCPSPKSNPRQWLIDRIGSKEAIKLILLWIMFS